MSLQFCLRYFKHLISIVHDRTYSNYTGLMITFHKMAKLFILKGSRKVDFSEDLLKRRFSGYGLILRHFRELFSCLNNARRKKIAFGIGFTVLLLKSMNSFM